MGISWTINARANCDYETLKIMREAGCATWWSAMSPATRRSEEHQEGGHQGAGDPVHQGCKKLGISIHGAFIMGCRARPARPSGRPSNMQEARPQLDPGVARLSPIPAPSSGTCARNRVDRLGELYRRYRASETASSTTPPHQCRDLQFGGGVSYNKFYFRPKYIARSVMKMVTDSGERKRLLKEGKQYLDYMKKRKASQQCK